MTYSPWGNCWRVQQSKDQQQAKQVTRTRCSRSWKLKNRNLLRWLSKLNLLTLYQGLKDVLTLKKLYWLVGFQVGKKITNRPVGCGGLIYMHHHSCNKLYVFFSFSPDPLAFPIERAMGNKTHTTGIRRLKLRLRISQKTVFLRLV